MTKRTMRFAAPLVVLAWCGTAAGQGRSAGIDLTLAEALARAQRAAPEVRAARARLREARGQVVAASPWLPHEPELEAAAGPRLDDRETRFEFEVGLGQRFELGGQRGARMGAAEARLEAATATAQDATRQASAETAAAFARGLWAKRRAEVQAETAALAARLLEVAERRQAAGEAGTLEVHLARVGAARADAQARAAEAHHLSVLGEVRAWCGMRPGTELRLLGTLEEGRALALDGLRARLRARPDLRALEAEARAATADVALGDAMAWPDLGLSARYAQEEGAHVFRGGISLTLPVFDRGRGARAAALGRREAAEVERSARLGALEARLYADFQAWRAARAAAEGFDRAVGDSLAEGLEAVRRSFEAGNVGLAEVLSMQREMVDARLTQTDLWLEVALLGIALEARAGTW